MKHYTSEEFINESTLENGIYWIEADGSGNVTITINSSHE